MRCLATLVALFLPCATVAFLCTGPPHHVARRSTALAGRARSHNDDNHDDNRYDCQERHSEFAADIAAFESSRGHPLVRVGAGRGGPGDTPTTVTLVLGKRRSN